MMKLAKVIPYLKNIYKKIWITRHPLGSADFNIFSREDIKFYNIKKYRYRLHFNAWFLLPLTFFWVFKDFFIRIVTILKMLVEKATLIVLKVKICWTKCYDAHIFLSYFTRKVASCDSSFCNSSISISEVIIFSVL